MESCILSLEHHVYYRCLFPVKETSQLQKQSYSMVIRNVPKDFISPNIGGFTSLMKDALKDGIDALQKCLLFLVRNSLIFFFLY
uniref:Uncharacterized protein n=1 Tax=Pyxicephalus adspersus TaxID=30357 RepID=A0AAV3A8E0_PYXAD|nr:TPA: hypothetical protein GDO54_007955 [Pyxicephalus adspersus]